MSRILVVELPRVIFVTDTKVYYDQLAENFRRIAQEAEKNAKRLGAETRHIKALVNVAHRQRDLCEGRGTFKRKRKT